jgi:hypothetical protein
MKDKCESCLISLPVREMVLVPGNWDTGAVPYYLCIACVKAGYQDGFALGIYGDTPRERQNGARHEREAAQ